MPKMTLDIYELVRRLHIARHEALSAGLYENDLIALMHPADYMAMAIAVSELSFIDRIGSATGNPVEHISGIPIEERPLPESGSVWLIDRRHPDFVATFKVPMKEVRESKPAQKPDNSPMIGGRHPEITGDEPMIGGKNTIK